MLVTFLFLGTRVFKSASCRRSAQAQHGKISFQASKRVSEQNYIVDSLDSSLRADRRMAEIAVRGVAPRLVQWIAPILCAGMDGSRPSQRTCGTRSSHVGFSAVTSSKGEGFMSLYISKPRTPKHRKCPNSGPQYQRAVSAIHLKGTPGAQLGSPPFRPSRFRSARSSSLVSPMREVTRVSKTRAHSVTEWV
jgi:hypothetical protein